MISIKGHSFETRRYPTRDDYRKWFYKYGEAVSWIVPPDEIVSCPTFYIWQKEYWVELDHRYCKYSIPKFQHKNKYKQYPIRFCTLPTCDIRKETTIKWSDTTFKRFDGMDYMKRRSNEM